MSETREHETARLCRRPHRHHRHRRFRVRPEALGQRYWNVSPLSSPCPARKLLLTEAVQAPEPLAETERELKHRLSRRAVRICAGLLVLVWALQHYKWFLALFWQAANAWPLLNR